MMPDEKEDDDSGEGGGNSSGEGNGTSNGDPSSSTSSTSPSSASSGKKEPPLTVKDLIDVLEAKNSKHQPAGRVVCFNTNKSDALPGALINFFSRQARTFEFCNAGDFIMREYWELFFLDHNNRSTTCKKFQENYNTIYRPKGRTDDDGKEILLDGHSPSAMQSYCMRYRDRPEEACKFENVLNFLPHEQSGKQGSRQEGSNQEGSRQEGSNQEGSAGVRKNKLKLVTSVFQRTVEIEHGISLDVDRARKLMDDPRNMVGQQRNKAKALDAAQQESRDQIALIRVSPLTMATLKIATTFGLSTLLIFAGEITRRYAGMLARVLQSINTALSLGFNRIDTKTIRTVQNQLRSIIAGVPILVLSLQAWEWWKRKRWSTYRCQYATRGRQTDISKALKILFDTRLGPDTSRFIASEDKSMHGKLLPSQKVAIPLSSASGEMPSSSYLKIDMSPHDQGQVFDLLTPIWGAGIIHYHDVNVTLDDKESKIFQIGWSLTNENNVKSSAIGPTKTMEVRFLKLLFLIYTIKYLCTVKSYIHYI